MTPEQWAAWAGPAALVGFATVLWWLARKFDSRMDKIESMLVTELRSLDVRLSVVEVQVAQLRK